MFYSKFVNNANVFLSGFASRHKPEQSRRSLVQKPTTHEQQGGGDPRVKNTPKR